jgi:hypothetical protein
MDPDFRALGTESPAEELIGIRFRWYAHSAVRERNA